MVIPIDGGIGMADFNASIRRLSSPKFRRGASIAAFWILIGVLAAEILQTYLVDGETQQSAYGMIGMI